MSGKNQFNLLIKKRFFPFFTTQALGALNDNIFRNALATLIVFQAGRMGGLGTDQLVNLAALLFILPFFLFSAMVGQFADKYEKAAQIRRIKLLEVGICLFAAVGFYFDHLPLLLAVLFLLGLQSTLFGPIKYAILPQLLDRDELTGGNGLVAAGTFIAILAGTIAGPLLAGIDTSWPYWVLVATLAVAAAGYAAAWFVPRVEVCDPGLKINWNPFTETWRNLRFLGGNRVVFNGVLGVSWFWFYGSIFLVQIPSYTQGVLGGNEQVLSALLALFIIGISAGSMLCEKLSGRGIEIGLVPIGAFGLTLFGGDLLFASPAQPLVGAGLHEILAQPGSWRIVFDFVMIGVTGGLFIVPLYALIQDRSDPERRSRVIAGMNIINAALMVTAAIFAMIFLGVLDFSIPELFAVVAVINLAVAAYIFFLVPAFVLRFIMWVLTRLMYRVDARGLYRVPESGPAVLVSNHVSFMDPLLIGGSVQRPTRFVMYHRIHDRFGLKWLFRLAGAIPIAPAKEDPECLDRAYAAIDEALARGELVCIFPEGGLTPDGRITDFKPGLQRILEKRPVPVIPLALEGLWGSVFSRAPGRWRRRGRGFFSRVRLAAAAPVKPSEADIPGLEIRVRELYRRLEED